MDYQFPDISDVPIPALRMQKELLADDPETPSLYTSESYFAKYLSDPVLHAGELKELLRHVPSRKTARRYYIKSLKPKDAPPLRPTATDEPKKQSQDEIVAINADYERAFSALHEEMRKLVADKQFERCILIRNRQSKLMRFKDELDNGDASNVAEFRLTLKRTLMEVDVPHMKATPKHFTVVTWNVWQGDFERERRWEEIVRTVARHQPHVICFQEVSASFVEVLDRHSKPDGLLHYYGGIHHSDDRIVKDSASDGGNTGVLLLTHKAMGEPYRARVNLTSQSNRWLETASWKVRDTQLTVATVQLESNPQAKARVDQMNAIFTSLKEWDLSSDNKSVIMAGDFNFSPLFTKEQSRLDAERSFVDLWSKLHEGDPGYTKDTDINLMSLRQSDKGERRGRLDRVLLHSPRRQMQGRTLKRIGTNALPGGKKAVFPSDHFGLVANFVTRWDADEKF